MYVEDPALEPSVPQDLQLLGLQQNGYNIMKHLMPPWPTDPPPHVPPNIYAGSRNALPGNT